MKVILIAACVCWLAVASAASPSFAQQTGSAPKAEPRGLGSALGRLWDRSNTGKQTAKSKSAELPPPAKTAPMIKLRAPAPPPPPLPEEEVTEVGVPVEEVADPQANATSSEEDMPPAPEEVSSEPEPARLPSSEEARSSVWSARLADGMRYGPVNRAAFKEPGGSRIPPVKAALTRRFESVPSPEAKPEIKSQDSAATPAPAGELAEMQLSVDDLSPARTMRAALPSSEIHDENLRTASAENASPAELLRAVRQIGRTPPAPASGRIVARTTEQPQGGLRIPRAPLPEQGERSMIRRDDTPQLVVPTPMPEEVEPTEEPVEEVPQPVAKQRQTAPPVVEETLPPAESGDELPTISGSIASINYNGKVVKLTFPEGTHLNLGDRVEVYHRALFRTSYAGELEIIDHKRGLARPVDGLPIQKLSKGDEVVLTLDPVL